MANTVRKLGESLIAEHLQDIGDIWRGRAFGGRKGRGAMDSVMIMDQLRRKHPGKHVHGRDIHSAFNSIDTTITVCSLIKARDLGFWVKDFLALRSFQIKTNRIIGESTMMEGTPQGSPLSPILFTMYLSAMVKRVDEKLQRKRNERHNLRNIGRPPLTRAFESLQFIDYYNSIVRGNVKDMEKTLERAAEEFKLKWDRSKDWKNEIHLGVNLDTPEVQGRESECGVPTR